MCNEGTIGRQMLSILGFMIFNKLLENINILVILSYWIKIMSCGKQFFLIKTYYVSLNNICSELCKRKETYVTTVI